MFLDGRAINLCCFFYLVWIEEWIWERGNKWSGFEEVEISEFKGEKKKQKE